MDEHAYHIKNQSYPYFSYKGRIPRSKFWYYPTFGVLFFIIFLLLMQTGNEALQTLAVVMYIFVPIVTTVIFSFPIVKRLHDLNWSGWLYWILIIPLLNLILIIILMAMKGTKGENKYGPDSLA